MKTIFLLGFVSVCTWSFAIAQIPPYLSVAGTATAPHEEVPPLVVPDELSLTGENNNAWFPDFKGYVRDNIRYPISAREAGIEGVVHAEAVVDVAGKLTDIRISEGLSYSCDKEVKRLLSGMPAWKPARRDGIPAEQKIYLRVRFHLKPL